MVESDVDQELLFHVPLVAQVNDVCIHIHVNEGLRTRVV